MGGDQCSHVLQAQGRPSPRTCQVCGLGPCRRALATGDVEPDTRARDAIAHCLTMGQGLYPTPTDLAAAILTRLANEGFAVVRKRGISLSEKPAPKPELTWAERQPKRRGAQEEPL